MSGAAARDTLGSVVAAGEHLPDPLAGQLVAGAREAFVLGFRVTAVTSGLIATAMAVLIAVFLRRAGTEPDVGEETLSRDSGPAEVAAVEEAA
jgi:MFS transporter, DHA2 family, multidrug resistance protein